MILRKGFIYLFLTLLLISQHTFGQSLLADLSSMVRDSIFRDPFDTNKNRWITDNEYLTGRFENGHLVLKCKNFKGSGGLDYVAVPLDRTRDFELEASFEILKGAGGLVFGMNDKFDHYRIEITDKNDIVLLNNIISRNKIEKLYTFSGSSFLKKGSPSKVKISKYHNTYYLFINDSFVRELNNIKPEGDRIGFNVSVNSEISADYLKVSYLKKVDSPVLAERKTEEIDSVNIFSQLTKSGDAPLITWKSPAAEKSVIHEFSAPVRARVFSKSPLEKVLFYVNGVPLGESLFQPVTGESGSYLVERLITFKPGDNIVYFIAVNEKQQTAKSEIRYFTNPDATQPVISWGSPAAPKSSVNRNNIVLETFIKSPSGINSVKIIVNGVVYVEDNTPIGATTGGEIRFQRQVPLKEGENNIQVIAINSAGSGQSDERTIIYNKALAEKRLALVIGNAEYKNKSPLKNPINDANLMEVSLKELGFDVIKCLNASLSAMKDSIRQFSQKLPDYNVALFYYAGHGVQVDGINYLLPTDAILKDKSDCKYEAVRVDFIVEEFEKYPDNTNVVILDACRNNPFASWDRGGDNGFKAMNFTSGTIISFATSEGATAEDGGGSNGLFTEELVKQMSLPQPVESVFKKTRVEVKNRSNGKQVPQEWSKLNGDFYFKK